MLRYYSSIVGLSLDKKPRSNRIDFEELIQLDMACSHGANIPGAVCRTVWSNTTTEPISHEPHRVAAGAPATPTPTDHVTADPGLAYKKKSWRSKQAQFSNQLDRPKEYVKRGIDPKQRIRSRFR